MFNLFEIETILKKKTRKSNQKTNWIFMNTNFKFTIWKRNRSRSIRNGVKERFGVHFAFCLCFALSARKQPHTHTHTHHFFYEFNFLLHWFWIFCVRQFDRPEWMKTRLKERNNQKITKTQHTKRNGNFKVI